jgi:hypothetical protein
MATTYGSTSFASSGVTLVTVASVNDPQGNGPSWEYTYTGTESGINALAATLAASGVRYRLNTSEGSFGLTSIFTGTDATGDPNSEVPRDSYGLDTEGVGVSIFAHPTATIEANTYGNAALYRKEIEDAADKGESAPIIDATLYPFSRVLFSLLTKKQDAYELRRPILRRTRTFSARYAGRIAVEGRQKAWTTSSLISEFSLPSDISSRLPSDPPASETPYGTIWVWRLTLDTSEYDISKRMWSETRQWVFEAVSPTMYQVV